MAPAGDARVCWCKLDGQPCRIEYDRGSQSNNSQEAAMIRRNVLVFLAAAGVALMLPVRTSAQASSLETAKAKAFLGEWILTMEGGRGPQERPLSITDVGGKVAATLAGGRGGPRVITSITMSGADLVLKWNQQGPQGDVDLVMTLALKDGVLTVKQEGAGGQFSRTGTGKKKG